jgi:hypothetical protein
MTQVQDLNDTSSIDTAGRVPPATTAKTADSEQNPSAMLLQIAELLGEALAMRLIRNGRPPASQSVTIDLTDPPNAAP